MRLRYCPFNDITVRSLEGIGERLGRGAVVDFDRVIGKSVDGQPVTMQEALGEYAAAFTSAPPDQPSAPSPFPEPFEPSDAAPDAGEREE